MPREKNASFKINFNWINAANLTAVILLVGINVVAFKTGLAEGFDSKHRIVNILEQIGRYACMIFMVLPFCVKNWKFGFLSVGEMLLWVCSTVVLLMVYGFLWIKKRSGGSGALYGLAAVPVVLFLLNGILLRHYALIVASLLFGVCHLMIARENRG